MNDVIEFDEPSWLVSEEAQILKAYRTVSASLRDLCERECDSQASLKYTIGGRECMSTEASIGSRLFGVRRNGHTLVSWEFIEPLVKEMFTDPVTGIGDRRAFNTHFEMLCDEINNGWRGVVAFVDVDHFKTINDTYGHYVGDVALTRVASRCAEIFRREGFAARLGGDEFALSGECDSVYEAQGLMDELLASVVRGNEDECLRLVDLSISVGCVFIPGGSKKVSGDELFTAVDTALYRAKRMGRRCAVVEELSSFIPAETAIATEVSFAGSPLTNPGSV
jgi:diguanylate cyclase (GGDEF)-like protein